ncbi:MAG: hypothetical protein EZS28_000274 [Streblomastix strix]|uniref:Uncharacterized protein n=1 Tax=Streblomastix strix TaxID=222440 RepID=A0A5J4XA48_9EUKA|nr:MAG: hypothetical protein EZS28_000274 [Streblomastix strix]
MEPEIESTSDFLCYGSKQFSLNVNSPDLKQGPPSYYNQKLYTEMNSGRFKMLSKLYRITYEVWPNARDSTVQILLVIQSKPPKYTTKAKQYTGDLSKNQNKPNPITNQVKNSP